MAAKLEPYYQDVDGFRIPGVFSPDAFRSCLSYKPRPDDLIIATFPKCGTTWVQQIVTLIFTEGESVKDYAEFNQRTPFLELCGSEGADKMIRPGSIKVHLPYYMTPYSSEAKYIYVVRNPKDCVVSFFHHTHSNLYRYEKGNFNDYFERFMNGKTDFGEYFDHVMSWYEHRNDDNVLFITYEELKKDTRNMVKKIAKFIGGKYAQLIDEDEYLDKVIKHSSLDYMKKVFNDAFDADSEKVQKPQVDVSKMPAGLVHFMQKMAEYEVEEKDKFKIIRKGIVGDWRSTFSDEQNRRLDEKIEAKLKGTDIYNYWKSINCI